MRVLQLISSTGFYGAEAVVSSLARRLPDFGVEADVAHIRYAGESKVFHLEDRIPEVSVIPVEHRRRIDKAVIQQLESIMQRCSPDILHCHGYKPDIYACWLGRRSRVPIISTCHLWTRSTPMLRIYAQLDAIALRRFDQVVAVSTQIYKELLRNDIAETNLHYIPNGVAVEKFSAGEANWRTLFPRDAVIFGMTCRQVNAKGVDIMLRAMALLRQRRKNAFLLILGDGPYLKHYQKMARDLEVDSKVIFGGRCESIANALASMDVFALPSRDEGLPIALLEAMAGSLPVIATNVGSVPELFQDREVGFLIHRENPVALAEAMVKLIDDKSMRHAMGEQAFRVVAEKYSEYHMVRSYAGLYRDMLLKERAA